MKEPLPGYVGSMEKGGDAQVAKAYARLYVAAKQLYAVISIAYLYAGRLSPQKVAKVAIVRSPAFHCGVASDEAIVQ